MLCWSDERGKPPVRTVVPDLSLQALDVEPGLSKDAPPHRSVDLVALTRQRSKLEELTFGSSSLCPWGGSSCIADHLQRPPVSALHRARNLISPPAPHPPQHSRHVLTDKKKAERLALAI